MAETETPQPVVADSLQYWEEQEASYNGVLGGYGNGSLPRIESLGSRQFLLHIRSDLRTVSSAFRPSPPPERRIRALDVGAGVGRVTADTLLPLVSDVVLVEPVEKLVRKALERAPSWKGIADRSKSVTVLQATLQDFNPSRPSNPAARLGRLGFLPSEGLDDIDSGFDIVWCQWCLMYMSDKDLVEFLKLCKASLRDERSVIVVKENICWDGTDPDGEYTPVTSFDESDSSVTRSDLAWKALFRDAGLNLLHEQTQRGLPAGLYKVDMYAVR